MDCGSLSSVLLFSLLSFYVISFPLVFFLLSLPPTPPVTPVSRRTPTLLKPELPNIDVTFVSGFCHSKNNGEKRHFEHVECLCS